MKIKIDKQSLQKHIHIVIDVITSKSTLPILSNMLIETQKNNLQLTATDLNIGISCKLPVEIIEEGSITIPAKRFNDVVNELPEENITLTAKKNNSIIIEAASSSFKLMGLPKEEFPTLPDFKDKKAILFKQQDLKQMLNLTMFAVSRDEGRYVLNGILFEIKNNILKLVSTDGRRLSLSQKNLGSSFGEEMLMIVPIKTIQELYKNLKDEGDVSLVLGNNQLLFEVDSVRIISRLIEGEFPDYERVVPKPCDTKIKVNRQEFLWVLRRANLLTTLDSQAVKLEIFKNKMVVSKITPDIGEFREDLNVDYQGKELIVGFNPVYIIDLLKTLDDEEVCLELTDAEKPGVIRKQDFVYIVLPMRLG